MDCVRHVTGSNHSGQAASDDHIVRFPSIVRGPDEGVSGGFVYKTVPHVTLRSIANNPEIHEGMARAVIDTAIAKHADQENLVDQPEIDSSKVRVTGPFTVEAVPAPAVRPVTEIMVESKPAALDAQAALPGLEQIEPQSKLEFTEDVSVARYGETLRQRQWRDELASLWHPSQRRPADRVYAT